MSKSLLQLFRSWHRKIASLLFIFFFCISITAIMLGFKSFFNKTIFENKKVSPSISIQNWLSLDTLETLATGALNEKTNSHFTHSERIELRPAKGFINFSYKNNFYVQVDGATGSAIYIEQKNGSFIQDIHDGAILGNWFNIKPGLPKTIYTTLMGLALLLLTLTGFYMWYKPKQIKQSKR